MCVCVLLSYSITFSTLIPSLLNLLYILTHTSLHSVRGGVRTWGLLLFVFPPAWTLQGPAPPPHQQPRCSPPHPAPATTSPCPPPPTPAPQTSMHIAPGKWQPNSKLFRRGIRLQEVVTSQDLWLIFRQKLFFLWVEFGTHKIRRLNSSSKEMERPWTFFFFFIKPVYFSLTHCPSQ